MQSGAKTLSAGGGASLCCLLLLWLLYSHLLREGQLAVGTCEIVMLNRDSSVPRRTIARQTARCACRRGQIAGTTRARPACVDGTTSAWSQAGCLQWSHTWAVCSALQNQDHDPSAAGGQRRACVDGCPGCELPAEHPVHQGGSEGATTVEAKTLREGEKPPPGL
ncbi:chemokine-like protein TAFA-3 isoform X1 [Antennarius striatus]|uniref:chemokine-like protein TAFA-3 isoform X1 n=1 Tax=Antennarius striatus TaxID=241820 RepID=UPI0035AE907A